MEKEKPRRMYEESRGEESKTSKERAAEYVRTFEGPAEKLLEQLEEKIREGAYSHVLGVDASGRLPALIIGGYMSEIYKQEGRETPVQLFATPYFKSTSSPQLALLFAHAEALRQSGKKVLIVDDTLASGNSLKLATHELRAHDIPFDIAVFLAVNQDPTAVEQFRSALEADALYVGEDRAVFDGFEEDQRPTPLVKDKKVTGVRKEVPVLGVQPALSRVNISNPELITGSREEIRKMVREMVDRHNRED